MSRLCSIWPVALVCSERQAFLASDLERCPIRSNSSIAALCDAIALQDVACELRLNCYARDYVDYARSSSHRTCSRPTGKSSLAADAFKTADGYIDEFGFRPNCHDSSREVQGMV